MAKNKYKKKKIPIGVLAAATITISSDIMKFVNSRSTTKDTTRDEELTNALHNVCLFSKEFFMWNAGRATTLSTQPTSSES